MLKEVDSQNQGCQFRSVSPEMTENQFKKRNKTEKNFISF